MQLTPIQKLDEVLKILATDIKMKPAATFDEIYNESVRLNPDLISNSNLSIGAANYNEF